jgi:hypothetical protein
MANLKGRKGLILGIANEHSIAYGCARAMRADGAELTVTYLNTKTEPYVRPLADDLDRSIIMPCDVEIPGELEAVYRHCQTNLSGPAKDAGLRRSGGVVRLTNHELANYDRSRLSRCELTPFRECSSAVLLEDVAGVEVTV